MIVLMYVLDVESAYWLPCMHDKISGSNIFVIA